MGWLDDSEVSYNQRQRHSTLGRIRPAALRPHQKGSVIHMARVVPRAGADRVILYDALLATIPEIERKGAAMLYTSVHGNMFSLLTADGTLALRLSAPDREAFLKRYKTTLCEQYGTVMKEYVRVPAALLENTRELARHLELSYRYAQSLKPKATRKPAARGKTVRRARRAR